MTVFEEACLLSCEQWIDSFPTDIPKHDFSKNHQKMMNRLFDKMRNGKYHRFTKNTIKILLIAAILLSITTTALAVPSCREYIIKTLFDYSAYNLVDEGNSIDVDCLKVNYIPDDFLMTKKFISKDMYSYSYKNGKYYFSVDKYSVNSQFNIDTEDYDYEKISVDGKEGIFYKADQSENSVIFNNGSFIFIVYGNISKDEIIKISQGLK